jgi:hypothetical protein
MSGKLVKNDVLENLRRVRKFGTEIYCSVENNYY